MKFMATSAADESDNDIAWDIHRTFQRFDETVLSCFACQAGESRT
jgi:hypothetical protein